MRLLISIVPRIISWWYLMIVTCRKRAKESIVVLGNYCIWNNNTICCYFHFYHKCLWGNSRVMYMWTIQENIYQSLVTNFIEKLHSRTHLRYYSSMSWFMMVYLLRVITYDLYSLLLLCNVYVRLSNYSAFLK